MKGKFIAISGLDGAGKTTLLDKLHVYLNSLGHQVIRIREPGGTPTCELFRKVLKGETQMSLEPLTAKAELLLFYASRVQLVETVVKPALEKGIWVLADRFDLETLAYQGHGLGLIDEVITLSEMALGEFKPDLTLLLDIDLKTMESRIAGRGAKDIIEQRGEEYFLRVRRGFLLSHEVNSDRWKDIKLINGAADEEAVFTSATFAIAPLLQN